MNVAEYCRDYFWMVEDNDDSFRMWQGLVGPYYTPQLSNDGTLSFTNNGLLPNPEPVNLRGPQGAGIRIAGIAETAEGLPASAAAGDIWLVGEVSPYEGYSYLNGEWIDLGPLTVGPAGPPGPQGDDYELTESDKQDIAEISETLLLAELDETPLEIRYGGTGARNVAGAKENLGIDDIETKLGTWPLGTDAQDVAGAINEMIGNIELQVDDIQKLKDDLAAEFNPNLTYAKGSYCVYGGDLYLCHTAVATPGAWTGDTNWTAVTVGAEIKEVKEITGDGQLDPDFTATDLTEGLNELKPLVDENASDIEDLQGITGDGQLDPDFTATDLTGAANELKNTLNSKVDTSAIVNNVTTTSEGYVLDARAGKAVNDRITTIAGGLAAHKSGNTASSALSIGTYIYLTGNSTLSEGIYRVKSAISSGATYTTSNLTRQDSGASALNTIVDGGSGYVKLPDGTMLQYGVATLTASGTLQQIASSGIYAGSYTFTLPRTFIDSYFRIFGSSRYSTGYPFTFAGYPITSSQATIYVYDFYARSMNDGKMQIQWFAIGRWK